MATGWIVAFVVVVLVVVAVLNVVAQAVISRRAVQAVLWASAEKGLLAVEQWEVRAMGALMFENLPRMWWLRYFTLDYEFEGRCARTWKEMLAGYKVMAPRECSELFGEKGPS